MLTHHIVTLAPTLQISFHFLKKKVNSGVTRGCVSGTGHAHTAVTGERKQTSFVQLEVQRGVGQDN